MHVAILGATGYGGAELVRLLRHHPEVTITALYGHSQGGKRLAEAFPHLADWDVAVELFDPADAAARADVVFTATPAGVSHTVIPALLERGVRCIDLSGDFRLKRRETYRQWYGKETADEALLARAVYGLAEWFADAVRNARLVANPGCYPTATLLGLLPLVKEGLVEDDDIIVDAKSGVSGAGRSPGLSTHFSEVNENLTAYKIGVHQHIPEIEQTVAAVTGQAVRLTFIPHLVPMTRGILVTIYARAKAGVTERHLREALLAAYADKPFVRVRPAGVVPRTKDVYGSNYCDVNAFFDARTGRAIVVAVIDNLVKGAAGQAVQNLNLMMGWPETLGLERGPVFP
nr:N-acetyl-gamma-glutamyl-phosphate reductase [Bacillota bacterium]